MVVLRTAASQTGAVCTLLRTKWLLICRNHWHLLLHWVHSPLLQLPQHMHQPVAHRPDTMAVDVARDLEAGMPIFVLALEVGCSLAAVVLGIAEQGNAASMAVAAAARTSYLAAEDTESRKTGLGAGDSALVGMKVGVAVLARNSRLGVLVVWCNLTSDQAVRHRVRVTLVSGC